MRVEELDLLLELLRMPHVVGIEIRDQLAGGDGERFVAGRGYAGVRLPEERDPRSVRFEDPRRIVARAVIDDDDLVVGIRLRERALDRRADVPGGVVRRDDRRDPRHDAFSSPGSVTIPGLAA